MQLQHLIQQHVQMNHLSHQSHLSFRFHMPESVQKVIIYFEYDPLWECNKDNMRRSLDKEGHYDLNEMNDEGYRNLLTLSLNDPTGFRGAHHYFNTQQKIEISAETASFGFMKGMIQTGMWELIISCHGIFSDELNVSVRIDVEGDMPCPKQTCPLTSARIQDTTSVKKVYPLESELRDYRIELHSHTNHSDASQTTEELLMGATDMQLDWLAITDHNTVSALYEAVEILTNSSRFSINILPGIEYTTFYGHFLIHGNLEHVQRNWTEVSLDNINEYFKYFQQKGMNVTIAHPFDTGNPYCTGCRFDYPAVDYQYVDNIEVWNETNPWDREKNKKAYQHWLKLLEQGIYLNASMGRDWHRPTPGDQIAVTHVLAPKDAEIPEILRSLKQGRTYISLEPSITFKINNGYHIGDIVSLQGNSLQISLEIREAINVQKMQLFDAKGCIFEAELERKEIHQRVLKLDQFSEQSRLVRLELLDTSGQILLFTNPIYLDHNEERNISKS